MKTIATCVAFFAIATAAMAEPRNRVILSIDGPKVGSTSEGWAACRAIVRDLSPTYSLMRIQGLNSGRVRCWYKY